MTSENEADGDALHLWSVGIGVSDLARSEAFYAQTLGMKRLKALRLAHMDEVIMGLGQGGQVKGSRIVLMHWTDGSNRNYRDNPVKLVFEVDDAVAFGEKMRAAGAPIEREAGQSPVSRNILGKARDPDGYIIEYIQIVEQFVR